MRVLVEAVLAASVCFPLFAQPAALRVEYGKTKELQNVKCVYVSTVGPGLMDEAQRQLSVVLPSLTFAESEAEGDVTLTVIRKPLSGVEGVEPEIVTTAVLSRSPSENTLRMYLDASSRQKELAEAVREVLGPVVLTLQEANPRRFGMPSREALNTGRPKVHTTAGLRPGLTRREVTAVLGVPSQVIRGVPTEIWIYKTTDGTMRLVFSSDRLASVIMPGKQ